MTRFLPQRARYSIVEEAAGMVEQAWVVEVNNKRLEQGRAGKYTPGDKTDWWEIASFMLAHSLPVVPWVNYVVEDMLHPQINHLKSPKILTRYGNTAARRFQQDRLRIQCNFDAEKGIAGSRLSSVLEGHEAGDFETVMTKEELVAVVLGDGAVPLSSLFRYCWAVDQAMPDLALSYHSGAVFQYLPAPGVFDEIWADWIPVEFKKDARALFQIET